ncbi:MAG: MipA/OmpV family protein, partial [Alphaproteobacteria bacterium]
PPWSKPYFREDHFKGGRSNNHWFAGTDIGVTRLLGDAALSPISLRDTNVTVMGMAGYRF